MKVNVNVDAARLLLKLNKGEKRFAYAVVNTINRTLRKVQEAEKAEAEHKFTIRKSDFLLGAPGRGGQIAVIKPFASVSQGRPYGEIGVAKKDRLLLSFYEQGGDRPITKGKKAAAVPAVGGPARPSFSDPVPAAFRFSALGLKLTPPSGKRKRRAKGDSADKTRYGREGTYQIPGVGVFQRKGDDERSTLVYPFVKDQKLPDRLDYVAVAERTINRWFPRYLQDEVEAALIRNSATRASLS